MERSAHHLPSRTCPRIYDHHFAPSSASTAQPTSAHGTFRGPFVWRRLRNDRWGRMRWVFLECSRGPLHEPYGTTAYRNPPARMVRSAVLLFGNVCGMIVGVDALGFFWVVTRTASRTLRNHRVSQPTSAHGTFRGPFIWRRLRNDRWGRMRWGFLEWSRGPLHEPYGTAAYRRTPCADGRTMRFCLSLPRLWSNDVVNQA